MKKNILITGMPGVGKTTLTKKILASLSPPCVAGFYTEESREQGIRRGFSLVGTNGAESILSHANIQSRFRIGKYGVDVNVFERFIGLIPFYDGSRQIFVIDEVGRMDCFSEKFIRLVEKLLLSEKPFIATVALRGPGFISDVKCRQDVELIEITKDNRNDCLHSLFSKIPVTCRT